MGRIALTLSLLCAGCLEAPPWTEPAAADGGTPAPDAGLAPGADAGADAGTDGGADAGGPEPLCALGWARPAAPIPATLAPATPGARLGPPARVDLNCDGWADVLAPDPTGGVVHVLYGGDPPGYEALPVTGRPHRIAVADFDAGGRLDLALWVQEDATRWAVLGLLGGAGGQFEPIGRLVVPSDRLFEPDPRDLFAVAAAWDARPGPDLVIGTEYDLIPTAPVWTAEAFETATLRPELAPPEAGGNTTLAVQVFARPRPDGRDDLITVEWNHVAWHRPDDADGGYQLHAALRHDAVAAVSAAPLEGLAAPAYLLAGPRAAGDLTAVFLAGEALSALRLPAGAVSDGGDVGDGTFEVVWAAALLGQPAPDALVLDRPDFDGDGLMDPGTQATLWLARDLRVESDRLAITEASSLRLPADVAFEWILPGALGAADTPDILLMDARGRRHCVRIAEPGRLTPCPAP